MIGDEEFAKESIEEKAAEKNAATTIPRIPAGKHWPMNCGKILSWEVFRMDASVEFNPASAGKSTCPM